jgi:hypothetical protein
MVGSGSSGAARGRCRKVWPWLCLSSSNPLVWSWGFGYSQGRLPIWYAELAFGLALLVWVVASSRGFSSSKTAER